MQEYRFNTNPAKEEFRKTIELKYTITDVSEFPKIIKEVKKLMKNRAIDYIDFDFTMKYYLPGWFELKNNFNKK